MSMRFNVNFYYEGPLRNDYSWNFHLINISFGFGDGMYKGTRQFHIAVELLFWSVIVTFTRFTKQRRYDKFGTKV